MHIYILFAHPSDKSFCREVLETFVDEIKKVGHSFEVNDLYKEGFQSEMDREQYLREVGGNPDAMLSKDIEVEHKRIFRADILVFIFPVWWSDVPAKLKGWFDRVWSYGYAYLYEKDGNRRTRMPGRKAIVICSAGHTEDHLRQTGISESMQKIIVQDRLSNVGFTDIAMEILGGMMPNDMTYHDSNLERVRRIARSMQ